MSDSRMLRVEELKRLSSDAQKRIESLSRFRAVVIGWSTMNASDEGEKVWLVSILDNRRALMAQKLVEYERGIELAREYLAPEIGALFIDGAKV